MEIDLYHRKHCVKANWHLCSGLFDANATGHIYVKCHYSKTRGVGALAFHIYRFVKGFWDMFERYLGSFGTAMGCSMKVA